MAASAQAMADPALQGALVKLASTLGQRNKDAWAALADSDLLREKARKIKDATLAELDKHIETLEASVKRRRGQNRTDDPTVSSRGAQ